MTENPLPIPAPFQKALLDWYDRHKRPLPWRADQDPYRVFVSEMMLQQTQVKTVIPYYERFMRELPDWKSLAKAREEKVLKLWEGLGYYRRARNLKAAAQMVVKDFGGLLPNTLEEITRLPGVGPYSAGALLSIAHQKPHPLVDGNVIRVFARLFLLKGDLKTGTNHQNLWEIAAKLLSQKRPGDFNQALMEIGATVCLSENPQCLLCPLRRFCGAAQGGVQSEYPQNAPRQALIEVPMAAFLIRFKKKVLVKKRSEEERWLKGLWEFPSAEGKNFEEARRKLEVELRTTAQRRALREVRHQITNHKIRLRLFPASVTGFQKVFFPYRWVDPSQLESLPFSSAQNKLRDWVQTELYGKEKGMESAIMAPRFKGQSRPRSKKP